jgi:glycosyltransferase involved in cell wall biosynthesis
MHVIYSIGAKFAGGGIGTTAYHAVHGLHRHGMLYRLLCGSYRPTDIPVSQIRTLGLLSRLLRRLAVYDAGRRLDYMHNLLYDLWACRRVEPCDLFHGWGGFCLRSLNRARNFGAVTVVVWASVHPIFQTELLQEEYRRWGLRFERPRSVLQRVLEEIAVADYVLIPSDFVRQTFLTQGVAEEKLIQIPFGVDVNRFRPAAQERRSGPFRVLFVGQVNVGKGVLYLLDAWQQLCWRGAELWMVGRAAPEARPLLARYADSPGVRFLGHVADPVSVYQQADLFVFPSLHEGSALVTYEALACGRPVVTTPNAGSVVRHGVEGFIVPIRDVEALAAGLERLRADGRLRQAMGEAARRRAEGFTWVRYGDSLAQAMAACCRDVSGGQYVRRTDSSAAE